MKKPENLSQFNARMEAACEGTAWEWQPGYWCHDTIMPRIVFTEDTKGQMFINDGPNIYAPAIYFTENPFDTHQWRFEIQTTSVGALSVSEIEKFAAALLDAAALVKKLTAIVAEYYEYD